MRLIAIAASLACAQVLSAQAPPASGFDPALCKPFAWRELGPYRGGRCAAVCGVLGQRDAYWMGATGGGVWKTRDGGRSWKPMADGTFGGSIGAVAAADSDPNVVYAGGGEKTVRGNVSHGDGIWKSTDGGKTWQHKGLADSRHVCRIRIHPRDPDLVYVAALGHLFGPSAERGVFRSRDGGATWQRVLHANDDAGAVDLVLDPSNPRILYATLWRVRRTPWSLESGGEGSGLWKSCDGGDTWADLTHNEGLAKGPLGICGISVSRGDQDSVYAIVEAEEGGVFRSRDGGKTWTRTSSDRALRQRAWYYTRIYADPGDVDTVYVVNVRFHRSTDGGKTFTTIDVPHGDNHDLWIDPADPERMILGNDGGATVTTDGGKTWTGQDNQPTAQIYRVSVDRAFPYRVLGAQQDNSALRLRSRPVPGERDFEATAGGESGWIAARPDAPDVVYGGSYGGYLQRVDHRTGERRAVDPWPDNPMGHGAEDARLRFQWSFPLLFSQHDPATLYAGAQVLLRSRDGGSSWDPISPDLTRNDRSKLGPSGGPITKDNTGVEYYCTLFAVAESAHDARVLWVGSDDGRVHVTRDGGGSWRDATPPDLPEWAQINDLAAHPFEPGGAYLAATRYKSDDFAPYLYRTADFGETWTRIVAGIDPAHFTRTIAADPDRRGLLYAGTERGPYVSFDDGGHWQPLGLELPIVPITDLVVHEKDLVAATQGRGFWVLDDLGVLQQMTPELAAAKAHLLMPRAAYRMVSGGSEARVWYWLGEAPPAGVAVQLEIQDASGATVRAFRRKPAPDAKAEQKDDDGEEDAAPAVLTADKGLNRFAWDLRWAPAERFRKQVLWTGGGQGPRAVPGTYTVKLTVGEWSATAPLELRADPRSSATAQDRTAQLRFALGVRDKLGEVHRAIRRIRDVRAQIEAMRKRAAGVEDKDALTKRAEAVAQALTAVEEALYQTRNQSAQDPLNFPIRLNDKLAGVLAHASGGDFAPTRQAVEVRDVLVAAIDQELDRLRRVFAEDLPELNRLAAAAGVPAVAEAR